MVKAETVVIDYKAMLEQLEHEIDEKLNKKQFKFQLKRREIPFEYVESLLNRYKNEGGFVSVALVGTQNGYQKETTDETPVWNFEFIPPTKIIRP